MNTRSKSGSVPNMEIESNKISDTLQSINSRLDKLDITEGDLKAVRISVDKQDKLLQAMIKRITELEATNNAHEDKIKRLENEK